LPLLPPYALLGPGLLHTLRLTGHPRKRYRIVLDLANTKQVLQHNVVAIDVGCC